MTDAPSKPPLEKLVDALIGIYGLNKKQMLKRAKTRWADRKNQLGERAAFLEKLATLAKGEAGRENIEELQQSLKEDKEKKRPSELEMLCDEIQIEAAARAAPHQYFWFKIDTEVSANIRHGKQGGLAAVLRRGQSWRKARMYGWLTDAPEVSVDRPNIEWRHVRNIARAITTLLDKMSLSEALALVEVKPIPNHKKLRQKQGVAAALRLLSSVDNKALIVSWLKQAQRPLTADEKVQRIYSFHPSAMAAALYQLSLQIADNDRPIAFFLCHEEFGVPLNLIAKAAGVKDPSVYQAVDQVEARLLSEGRAGPGKKPITQAIERIRHIIADDIRTRGLFSLDRAQLWNEEFRQSLPDEDQLVWKEFCQSLQDRLGG